MKLDDFIAEIHNRMNVRDFVRYRIDEIKSTNVVFAFDGELILSIGVFDDEDEDALFTIFYNKELLAANKLSMDELIEAFGV